MITEKVQNDIQTNDRQTTGQSKINIPIYGKSGGQYITLKQKES